MSVIVPSSGYLQVFIMSLTDKDPTIWNAPDQMKVQAKKRGPFLDSYIWNLHSIGDKLGSLPLYPNSNSKRLSATDKNWKLIFVDNYSDDQGSNFITTTDTFNSVASFTHPTARNLITKTNITFSPLINQGNTTSDVADGHEVIYKCFIFPSYPIVISTTIAENEHYGPIFANSLNISANDRSKSVNVNASFLGGRALFLPPMKIKNLNLTRINSVDNQLDANPYRTATIFDCAVEFDIFPDFQSFMDYNTNAKNYKNKNDFERIVDINLSVSQTFTNNITANSDSRRIQQGPRFWNMTDRKVSGSITWLSNQYNFYIPTSSSLTMYFGTGFYFPMENVDWQKPKITAVPGQGYLHQFNFIARAVSEAVANGFKSNSIGSFVSEFKVPTYIG